MPPSRWLGVVAALALMAEAVAGPARRGLQEVPVRPPVVAMGPLVVAQGLLADGDKVGLHRERVGLPAGEPRMAARKLLAAAMGEPFREGGAMLAVRPAGVQSTAAPRRVAMMLVVERRPAALAMEALPGVGLAATLRPATQTCACTGVATSLPGLAFASSVGAGCCATNPLR